MENLLPWYEIDKIAFLLEGCIAAQLENLW